MTAPPARKSRRTLLLVLAVAAGSCIPCTGIAAAIAIPSFIGYVRRAKAAEARANLHEIALGVSSAYEMPAVSPDGVVHTAERPFAIPLTPSSPPGPERRAWPSDAHPGWAGIGFAPAPVYYSYEVVPNPGGDGFVVRAIGDLDGDGVQSTYELHARSIAGGAGVAIDREPTVTNELE